MLFEKIGTGATIQEALENAKALLSAPENVEPSIEVLQQPQKKTLGIFGKELPAKVRVFYEIADEDATLTYLKAIITRMGVKDFTVAVEEKDDEISYQVDSDSDYGILIGRRGETLDSIQYLLRLAANNGLDEDRRKVVLNVGTYREKRSENLRALAGKTAKQVLKYGRSVALEPMNPYERRIIHTAIQEIEGVTSHSVGYDSERKVIISLAEGTKPTHPSSGYNNNRGNGNRPRGGRPNGNYNNGNRDRAPRNNDSKPEAKSDAQNRAPRKDSTGPLYGKIDYKQNNED